MRHTNDAQSQQTQSKAVTISRIYNALRQMRLTTEHGRRVKSNTIAHLLSYEESIRSGHTLNVGALGAAIINMNWMIDHITHIDDKRVLPSERLFLCQAARICQQRYDIEKSL
ncbi:hypothetical protein [Moraxella canis]|uniref:hypothetical protein n=1 Tax=Moraxella canis TaxID=90239 RepID=UPI0006670A48|nr:hypothetical protein [Moraxella canis]